MSDTIPPRATVTRMPSMAHSLLVTLDRVPTALDMARIMGAASGPDALPDSPRKLIDALEAAMNVLVSCVTPAGGCDDEAAIADAIAQGEAALAAAGRVLVRA